AGFRLSPALPLAVLIQSEFPYMQSQSAIGSRGWGGENPPLRRIAWAQLIPNRAALNAKKSITDGKQIEQEK
ncbi:MAG TPA: hypothetical protein VJZ77_18090, partial [Blastocatellia bacterium]|nr:hypothetical protein [Blastocatellia bacterium]